MNTIDALTSLRPTAEWAVSGDEITWLDKVQTQPTDAEIQAEIVRLQTEYDNKKYQRDRDEAYPSIQDQLDDLYHNGIDGWKATIKTTKDKFPKE